MTIDFGFLLFLLILVLLEVVLMVFCFKDSKKPHSNKTDELKNINLIIYFLLFAIFVIVLSGWISLTTMKFLVK